MDAVEAQAGAMPEAAAPVAPATAASAAAVDAGLGPAQWLQRIRERRDRGELDAARASLALFTRTHPQLPVPDDLLPLLP